MSINKTIASEFISEQGGQLRHIRTGQLVKQLEVQGTSKRGQRLSTIIIPDKGGLKALDSIPLTSGVKQAKLENGEFIILERIGGYKTHAEKTKHFEENQDLNREKIFRDTKE